MAAPSRAARECIVSGGYKVIHEFSKDLTLCPRGHSVAHDGQWYNVYCFAKAAADADTFMRRFGGETFEPIQRGKGSNWAKWNKA